MYFSVAKSLAPFAYPLGLGCLVVLGALLLSWSRPGRARLLLVLGLVLLAGLGLEPVAVRLMAPLERAYPPPPPGTEAAAAVVLAGTVDLQRSTPEHIEFYDRPERVVEGARLVKEGRARWLVISGGSGDPRAPEAAEAELLAAFATELGVPKAAVVVQTESRTTHEDAVRTARVLRDRGIRRFFLVTSAFHLPRAVACFRKAGLEPIPYPVDFRVTPPPGRMVTPAPTVGALQVSTLAVHEYLGYAAYWVLGYL